MKWLPDGVTVAQQTLNLFVMVQIHVGQPILISDFGFTIYKSHFPALRITSSRSLIISM